MIEQMNTVDHTEVNYIKAKLDGKDVWFIGQANENNEPNGFVRYFDGEGSIVECKIIDGKIDEFFRSILSDGASVIGW